MLADQCSQNYDFLIILGFCYKPVVKFSINKGKGMLPSMSDIQILYSFWFPGFGFQNGDNCKEKGTFGSSVVTNANFQFSSSNMELRWTKFPSIPFHSHPSVPFSESFFSGLRVQGGKQVEILWIASLLIVSWTLLKAPRWKIELVIRPELVVWWNIYVAFPLLWDRVPKVNVYSPNIILQGMDILCHYNFHPFSIGKKRISLPSLFSEKSLYATIIYHTESDFFLEICIVKFTVGYIILDPFRLQLKKNWG